MEKDGDKCRRRIASLFCANSPRAKNWVKVIGLTSRGVQCGKRRSSRSLKSAIVNNGSSVQTEKKAEDV